MRSICPEQSFAALLHFVGDEIQTVTVEMRRLTFYRRLRSDGQSSACVVILSVDTKVTKLPLVTFDVEGDAGYQCYGRPIHR